MLLGSALSSLLGFEEWMYVYHRTLNQAYIQKRLNDYQNLCITGFQIDSKGNLLVLFDLNSYQKLLENKRVFMLISLKSTKDGKEFLQSEKTRFAGIKNIMEFIKKYNYFNVHIDFEYLSEKETLPFSFFLRDLQKELRKENRPLTIAVFPPIWDMKYKDFHNLKVLSPYVDEVVVMMYDYHNPKTQPGPVSELSWIEKNIQEILKFFQPEQVWLGLPLYGYSWDFEKKKVSVIDYTKFIRILNDFKDIQITKSSNYGYKLVYQNRNKILFYPDEEFRQNAIELAKKNNLKGVAYWRLGYEKQK
ncbi:MAG: glycosyl hydrolase family 18 protein [Leptospiraceae bacterium]|nr:glycosyl hydrolase family 18 protein [Leptospiraceae bacterium]MDW7976307.1 glycosyl hydrolase family 18 protein [Leptospiraceae bacterium]